MGLNNNRKLLKTLHKLHTWLGFNLAIMMFLILITGTFSVLSNEMDWLFFKQLRASEKPADAASKASDIDWVNIYKAVKEKYPDGQPRYLFSMGEDYLTYRAIVDDKSLHQQFVQIDQWTYDVTGTIPRLTVQRFLRDLHRSLFMPTFPGIVIVCTFGFVLVISIYTGLKATKNWKTALWRIRLKQGVRVALSDTHKILGLWGVWFSILICVTGIWYFYEFSVKVFGSTLEPEPPKLEQNLLINDGQSLNLSVHQFQQIISKAQSSHDNWYITSIIIPAETSRPIEMRGVKNNPLLRDRAYRVFIDPISKQLTHTFTPESIGVNAYLNEYADPLHFGNFGGIWSKLIWFIFGLALSLMSVTGVVMTWKRTKIKTISKTQIYTLSILGFMGIAFIAWFKNYA